MFASTGAVQIKKQFYDFSQEKNTCVTSVKALYLMAQMSFFQVGIGLSSSPLGLAAYIMEKVANTTIQIKPGNQTPR